MKDYALTAIRYIFSINRRDLWLGSVTIISFLLILTLTTTFSYASDVVDKQVLLSHNQSGVVLYDKNGTPFFTFFQGQTGNYLPLGEIPKVTQEAVIASEDKDFYKHRGFSFKAIIRSAIADVKDQGAAYGGSTITQQLVKNSLLTSQKDILRKYQEVVLAEEVEKNFSKDQILEMYLNTIYFGDGANGIDSASHNYFNKDPKDLDLAENSFLAGILPAPSQLSPYGGDIETAKVRQKYVLDNMVEKGFITKNQEIQAYDEKLIFRQLSDNNLNKIGAHFAIMVLDQLIKAYGQDQIEHSGYKVYTTLDLNWQSYAEDYLKNYIEKIRSQHASNGAIVVMDPKTGEIRTLVGSYNWYDNKYGKVNAATTPRQPGSSFKPIVYLAAFERGTITPATQLKDLPTEFRLDKYTPAYKPHDYDGRFRGMVTVRRALANSLNVPAVDVITRTGVSITIDMATQMGITTIENDTSKYGPSLALGAAEVSPLELTEAYSVLADQGYKNDPTIVDKIVDKTGKVIYQYQPDPVQIASPEHVFQVTSILSDNNARREIFGNELTINRPAAVKTGTTDNNIDTWTLGYTPSLVIGIWVGNNNHTPTNNLIGAIGAAPVWKDLMEHYLEGIPIEQFNPPSGLEKYPVCKGSGSTEYFIKGTEPKNINCPTPTLTPTSSISPTPALIQGPGSTSPTPTPTSALSPTPSPQAPTPTPSPNSEDNQQFNIQINNHNINTRTT